MPDTALLLHHPRDSQDIDWHLIANAGRDRVDIVIPILVIEELDREKDAPGRKPVSKGVNEDTRTRARRALRLVDEMSHDPGWTVCLTEDKLPRVGPVYYRLCIDSPAHKPLAVADAELVNRAVGIRDVSRPQVAVASFDTSFGPRARTAELLSVRPNTSHRDPSVRPN